MRKALPILALALSLSACAMTNEEFYGTNDPALIQAKRAQLMNDIYQSNAALQQQTQNTLNQVQGWQAPQTGPYGQPRAYDHYTCLRTSSYTAACKQH